MKNNDDDEVKIEEDDEKLSLDPEIEVDMNDVKQEEQIIENCEMEQDEPKQTTGTDISVDDNFDADDDDESSSEHELTNLGWLIDLKNLAQWPVDSNNFNKKNSNGNTHSALANSCIINDIDDENNTVAPVISEKDLSEERFKKFTIQVKQ